MMEFIVKKENGNIYTFKLLPFSTLELQAKCSSVLLGIVSSKELEEN